MSIITEYPRFSDFADEVKSLEGDKKKIQDILNKEILITDFKIKDSKQHSNTQYITIQFKIEGVYYIVFTGSKILMEQLEKYKDNLPYYVIIKKIDKYYTLV